MPSRFLAVGHQGLRLVSEDGAEWKVQGTGKPGEIYRAACFGRGRYVAVGSYGGNNIFATSTDCETWQTGQKDAKYAFYLRGIGFGMGTFLGLGGDPGSVGSSKPFVMTTEDGQSWSDPIPIAGKNMVRRIAFGGDRFVAVGDRGRRATSRDGREWMDAPDVKAIDTLIDVAFGNGVFVGVGLNGLRMATRDGLKWSDRQVGEEGEHLNSVVWAGDRFVAVGMGATYFSADGASWTRAPNQDAPLAVAHGNGVFVGVHWKGRILRSTDALVWKLVHTADHHVEAVTFGARDLK